MDMENPQEGKTIHIPAGTRYLAGNLKNNDLPMNCLFDKGKTGCGGTTIALDSDKNYLILSPTKNLIKNKLAQSARYKHDIFGYYDDVDYNELIEYFQITNSKGNPLKIISTYDSFEFVSKLLRSMYYDPYKNLNVLVDEYHMLAYWYKLKPPIMRGVMSETKKYDNKCFMTATPLREMSLLKELEGYPTVRVNWEEKERHKVHMVRVKNIDKGLTELVKYNYEERIKGQTTVNLHIFLNSVNTIAKTVHGLKLPSEHVRIVCSENDKKNGYKLGNEYQVESLDGNPKMINFYTSTSFCGSDIYDKEGFTVIVSDAYRRHTLLDVSTMIPQVMGRIRDSRYKNNALHIFTENRYDRCKDEQDYIKGVEQAFLDAKEYAENLNRMDDKYIGKTVSGLSKTGILKYDCIALDEDGKAYADENIMRIDISNYRLRKMYTTENLKEKYQEEGMDVEENKEMSDEINRLIDSTKNKRYSFKNAYQEYVNAKKEFTSDCTEKGIEPNYDYFNKSQSRIWRENELVIDAYTLLGNKRVEELKYNTKLIRREIEKNSNMPEETKIAEMFAQNITSFPKKMFNYQIEKMAKDITKTLSLKKPLKARDIDRYYNCETHNSSIKGEKGRYIKILSPKYVI